MPFDLFISSTGVSLAKTIVIGLFGSVYSYLGIVKKTYADCRQYLVSFIGTVIYNLYFHPIANYPGIDLFNI